MGESHQLDVFSSHLLRFASSPAMAATGERSAAASAAAESAGGEAASLQSLALKYRDELQQARRPSALLQQLPAGLRGSASAQPDAARGAEDAADGGAVAARAASCRGRGRPLGPRVADRHAAFGRPRGLLVVGGPRRCPRPRLRAQRLRARPDPRPLRECNKTMPTRSRLAPCW